MIPKYKRVLLKLSGEAVFGSGISGYNKDITEPLISELKEITEQGTEVTIVIGGGNIFRGGGRNTFDELEETTGHYIGILGSLISALAFRDLLKKQGLNSEVVSPLDVTKIVPNFSADDVSERLSNGQIVIIGGGTGRTHCSTDTAAALFGTQLQCDILLKATKVDGVYSADPEIDQSAKKYDKISYDTAIAENLKVMDSSAFSSCKEKHLPIRIFNVLKAGNLGKIIAGENIGTLVS